MGERYTKVRLDLDELPVLSTPWRQLGATAVALGLIRLEPGQGYFFTHEHREQEEVYVVLEGAGTFLVDGELLPIERGDVLRVAPAARRALTAAPDQGLFAICAGGVAAGYPKDPNARYLIDDGIPHYDDVPPWYEGNQTVLEQNAKWAERMRRSAERR